MPQAGREFDAIKNFLIGTLGFEKCAEGAAIATGTAVETEHITASHEMLTNIAAQKVVCDNLILLAGQEPFWLEGIEHRGMAALLKDGREVQIAPHQTIAPSIIKK